MECERYRHAISAHLDGEEPGVDPPLLQHHLSTCSACRNWEHDAIGLARAVRVSSAEPIPDLTAQILVAIGQEPATARWDIPLLRVLLGLVGLVKLLVTGHALFFNELDVHVARELSSFELALAVGFLCAAIRPARAFGMVPLVTTVMALLVVVPLIDGTIAYGDIFTESTHQLQVAGFAILWYLARSDPQAPRSRIRLPRVLHGA
jgi:predicted anti-sigma-YlaC factor YlaD